MAGYILGITIGTITIFFGLVLLFMWLFNKRSTNKLIKKIGTAAEVKINADLKIWAKHTNNRFIPNSIYSYGENKVFEVDSILITSKALIVIEVKSIKGGIEGDALNPTWNKVLGTVRHDITNPVTQNDKHIDHIVKMTQLKIPTVSLIIYSNRAQYIKVENIPSHTVVTKHSELFDVLDEINISLEQVLNEDEVKDIWTNIKSFRTTKSKDVKLHRRITLGKLNFKKNNKRKKHF